MEITQVKNIKAASTYKYFHILACVYMCAVLTSITQASRLIEIHIPFIHWHALITGGTLTIPLAFFIQNIVTEVYGYTRSRHLVQLALLVVAICIAYEYLLTFLPLSQQTSQIQEGYNAVFKSIPRHILAFIASAFIGNLINDYLISKTKIYFYGKYVCWRFIFATALGEAAYMMFGILVWIKYIALSQIIPLIAISYIYRLAFEGVTLPFSYFLCNLLKKREGVDTYDNNVDYNPFLWAISNTKEKT